MPKLFVQAREGTFTADARARVADALTDLGIACERLSDAPKVRAGIWVFFTDHLPTAIYSGGEIPTIPPIGLIVYALEGGMDGASKQKFIKDATKILHDNVGKDSDRIPIYIAINEVPEANWGMYGLQVSLATLRAAP
ncbi:tautomerase family protein [Paraburkholderia caledonica]|uniref:tautomerase family protein n=1 Tax=Paraburkholderia caledonica TaxID=134536 RepID=UPI00036E46F5|nr:tautomerase family protein [Paraburkholderia caledonica]